MIRPLLTTLLALTLPLLACQATAGDEYIDVTGQGEAEAWPDYLELNMTVSATDKNAETAKSLVDQSMNQALALAATFNIIAGGQYLVISAGRWGQGRADRGKLPHRDHRTA